MTSLIVSYAMTNFKFLGMIEKFHPIVSEDAITYPCHKHIDDLGNLCKDISKSSRNRIYRGGPDETLAPCIHL